MKRKVLADKEKDHLIGSNCAVEPLKKSVKHKEDIPVGMVQGGPLFHSK